MMKQFLEAQGLTYKEVNVQSDPIAAKGGSRNRADGRTQTKVNGHWVLGFDPETLLHYVKK